MPASKNTFSPMPYQSLQDPNLHSGIVSVTGSLTVDLGIGHNNFVVTSLLVKSSAAADANKASDITWDYSTKAGTFTIYCWKATGASTTTLIAATAAVNVSFGVTVDSSVG